MVLRAFVQTALTPVVRREVHVLQAADIGGRVVADADLQGRAIDVVDKVQFIAARADADPLIGIDQGQVFEGGIVAPLLLQAIGIGNNVLGILLRIPEAPATE